MDENNNGKKGKMTLWILIAIIFVIMQIVPYCINMINNKVNRLINTEVSSKNYSSTFRIIASQENQPLEGVVKSYAKSKGYEVEFEYAGTLDIMQKINKNSDYDAVWLSNSIWGYMLDSSVKLTNSKSTSINPVIFGIKKSKAEDLGFTNKDIYTKDIVMAIAEGKLKFSMSNPTTTNSGASAYLGLLSTLAGNPEVLTEEHLKDEALRENLRTLFTGLERSSGSEDFLEELFLNGDYEAVVSYESSIISINKQLVAQGKEPLYAVYPIDGVSISDAPFAYIDRSIDKKKDVFTDIQGYILSDEGQRLLQEQGKRTWYGGISNNVDKSIFNPDWGIDTTKYISPIKYPSTKVTKLALNMYQTELRKPVHVVFCLDYSGSMYGDGYNQLKKAMQYILTDEAANDFIQFSDRDKIDIIPFDTYVRDTWSTNNGTETSELLNNINSHTPNGSTALYPAAVKALETIMDEDNEKYNVSIVLMTDGLGNMGTWEQLERAYQYVNKPIPIYSIMFGSASESQLRRIANLSNAKVFDAEQDLVAAFKEVRGYN